jgi:DNA-binding XRE family transcriptional regulator
MRKNLRAARKSSNLKMKSITNSLTITKSYYYKLERGEKKPSMTLAIKISKLFSEDIKILFSDLF